jgi:hypothetical protein
LQDLSLHILDIVENSIAAGARNVEIIIREDLRRDFLIIEINDDGHGMEEAFSKKAIDPFVTSRTERKVGFGLSLFAQAARVSNGRMAVRSTPRRGTRVKAIFQHSHIDRKPLGNIGDTLLTLVVGNPQVNFTYRHRVDARGFSFHSRDWRTQLEGRSISSSRALKILRDRLKEQ